MNEEIEELKTNPDDDLIDTYDFSDTIELDLDLIKEEKDDE